MLTGQADEKLAIEAFNEGLIHRYIKKSDVNAVELITQSIYDLQFQYFKTMSDAIERLLSIQAPRCLKNQKFIGFFNDFVKENQITEYYLADQSGSYFMLDDDANASFLIVKDEEEMNTYYELARAHGANETVLAQLDNRYKIPGLWHAAAMNESINDWSDALVPATPLSSDETYYYAHLQGNDLFNIRQPKILSYHRYLEELDAEELLMG